jgi:hypothetical protein
MPMTRRDHALPDAVSSRAFQMKHGDVKVMSQALTQRESWLWPLIVWSAIIAALYFGPAACSQQKTSETQVPDKFDNAVLLKICSDGTRVLRLTDGSVEADGYRVEDFRTVC